MAGSRRAALLAVTSASCSGEPFEGTVSHSQFFEYHDQVQEPLCPTLLSSLDDHAQMIGGKIGLKLDANNPYRYYKFRDAAAFAADSGGCPPENGACALGDAIYSDTYFHAHEQAHDYVYRAWGRWSDGLLNEGEAVALSCIPFYWLEPGQKPVDAVGALDWRDLLNLWGNSNEGYGAAGFFVNYLVAQYGWSSVEKLHQKMWGGTSADDFAKAFAEVFPGSSMDQAWAAAQGATGALPCDTDWRCIATSMAVGEVAARDCDGDMHRSVDAGGPGGAVLSLMGDDTELRLLSCDTPAATSFVLDGGQGGQPSTHWASLPPHSYTMFPGVVALPSSVRLKSYFSGPLVGGTCGSAPAVALEATGRTTVDLLPGGYIGWTRLDGGGRAYDVYPNNLIWDNLLTAMAVSICDDCTAASCVPIPFGQATRVHVSDGSVVRFQGAVASASAAWGQLVFDLAPP